MIKIIMKKGKYEIKVFAFFSVYGGEKFCQTTG